MMVAFTNKTSVLFDEFINWYPETSETRYELRRGIITEMPKPKGQHSKLAGELAYQLGTAFRQTNQPYFIPKDCIIKLSNNTGYEPDIIVLDESKIADENRWEQESIITLSQSIKLAVEIVSTNWRDDYLVKLADYEAFGIQEYWIVDYLGEEINLQSSIGNLQSVDGEYELQQFHHNDHLISATFPQLSLTIAQIFR